MNVINYLPMNRIVLLSLPVRAAPSGVTPCGVKLIPVSLELE